VSAPAPIADQVSLVRSHIEWMSDKELVHDLALWRAVLLTLIEVQSRTVNA